MSAALSHADERRRRVRRSALTWTLIAVGFYLSFIVLALLRGLK